MSFFQAIRRTALAGALTTACLAAGPAHSAGPAVGWGENFHGEATPPDSVNGTGGSAATPVAAGWDHSCAIQAGSGKVVGWGDDGYGQATPPPPVDGTDGTATAAELGLADATIIDTAHFEWPSGIVQELHGVPPRQFLTITEAPEPGQLLLGATNALALATLRRRRNPLCLGTRARDSGPALMRLCERRTS